MGELRKGPPDVKSQQNDMGQRRAVQKTGQSRKVTGAPYHLKGNWETWGESRFFSWEENTQSKLGEYHFIHLFYKSLVEG